MSTDLLKDIKDEANVLLAMNVSNFAFLSITDPDFYKFTTFCLTPNEQGLNNAEKIAKALLAWRDHVIKNSLVK